VRGRSFTGDEERTTRQRVLYAVEEGAVKRQDVTSQGRETRADLIVVAGEDGDAPLPFTSDDQPHVAVNAGFVIGSPDLLGRFRVANATGTW
jgi:hypothetical protein